MFDPPFFDAIHISLKLLPFLKVIATTTDSVIVGLADWELYKLF